MCNVDKLTHTVRKNHEPFAQGWYYGHYQAALWHKIVTTLRTWVSFGTMKDCKRKKKRKEKKESSLLSWMFHSFVCFRLITNTNSFYYNKDELEYIL